MASVDEPYQVNAGNEAITSDFGRLGADIERLALRISLADIDEQFEKVIQKSLVFILRYLAKYEDHRKKLMELLGDVTRRLKCRPGIQIPVHELFVSYNDPECSTFLTNFSHMYIRLGYPRMPIAEQISLLPVLYASLTENKPIVQRDVLLHLTLPIIGRVPADTRNRRELELHELPMQRRFMHEFYSLVLLLPYRFERLIRFDSNDVVIPEGFNAYDYSRVAHDRFSSINSPEDLEKYKKSIVQFYCRGFFPFDESILPMIFAIADTRHSVLSAAYNEVRTLSVLVDWEDETLLTRIFDWYLGRRREFDPKGRSDPRCPPSQSVRIKLGSYLLRSRVTLTGPLALDLIEAAILSLAAVAPAMESISQSTQQVCAAHAVTLDEQDEEAVSYALQAEAAVAGNPSSPFPTDSTESGVAANAASGGVGSKWDWQQRMGAEDGAVADSNAPPRSLSHFTSWTQQRKLADHGLDLLSHLLDNAISIPAATSVRALRGLINFVYERTSNDFIPARARGFELLSRFLAREPNYLLKDPGQLPRLFDVLSEDIAPDLKTAAAHCLRRLALTFQEAQRQNYPALQNQLVKLERLLYENMERSDPVSRLVAVHFAGVIYPPDHIPTRYLILQALGDKDQRVRAEARTAFALFLDPNVANDIVYGRVKLPSFVEFVNHDTQHSRKNPFIDVERLIPVVLFIRLCLLAVKGGLSPTQEAGIIYETDDEIRYRINQNVRYFLSASSSSASGTAAISCGGKKDTGNAASCGSEEGGDGSASTATSIYTGSTYTPIPNPEQAKRSIDTYFRLIHVVIFARCQTTRDSPEFPTFLEEVLVNNTKELITGGKPIFERMNSLLLATPRGANCRHACASIYSVVTMETEKPTAALQIAVNMLNDVPQDATVIDADQAHVVQGMMMGAAYLLKHLFDKHCTAPQQPQISSGNSPTAASIPMAEGKSKKGKKKEQHHHHQQQNQPSQPQEGKSELQSGITAAIEQFLSLLDIFLVRASFLLEKPFGKETKVGGGRYINASVAQSSVTALLEALAVLGQAGCVAHLPSGAQFTPTAALPTLDSPLPVCGGSKANLVTRISSYLALPLTTANATTGSGEALFQLASHQRVWFAALRTLAGLCTGEISSFSSDAGKKKGEGVSTAAVSPHPHLLYIIRCMASMENVRDPALHLSIGAAMADALLGPSSPYKGLWYERTYPLTIPPGSALEASKSAAGRWLAERFITLLTHKPGQVQTPPIMLAVALWALAMVRRFGPPPATLISPHLFINLLTENDDALQCVAASVLGLIYDRSSEEARGELVKSLTKVITDEKRPNTSVFKELCSLVNQIGRPDLALSLVVLSTTPLPPTVNASSVFHSVNAFDANQSVQQQQKSGASSSTPWLALCSVACAGLVRRLGRSLAPALPRLVPRIFVRRFDLARPRLRQAVQMVWLGLILYATPNNTSSAAAASSSNASTAGFTDSIGTANTTTCPSLNSMASDLVETHFNAIVCEIKTQLGFNTAPASASSPTTSQTPSQHCNSGSQDQHLRDACCLAVVALTEHPSAYKHLAGHLPSLLSGLLALVDEQVNPYQCESPSPQAMQGNSPAEKAATAVQKLVIKALDDPSCREVATGLLPVLLPTLINRALSATSSSLTTSGDNLLLPPSESRSLALDLLLAAARIARPSALRPALPQLTLAGLQTMASLSPTRVVSVMRPSATSPTTMSTAAALSLYQQSVTAAGGIAQGLNSGGMASVTCKEVQMAEVLRLCIRLIDETSLSRLILPMTELIRAGGGSNTASIGGSSAGGGSRGVGATSSAAVATATCIFISHLALSSSTLITNSNLSSFNQSAEPGETGQQIRQAMQPPPLGGLNSSLTTTTVSTSIAARRRIPLGSQQQQGSSSSGQKLANVSGGNVVVSLLAPHTGKLLAALLWALPGAGRQVDASSRRTVQEEMAQALAVLLRFAKDTSVAKVFSRVRSWFLEAGQSTSGGCAESGPGASSASSSGQWACVRVMHAIARCCPDLLFAHAGLTLPLVFINTQSEADVMQMATLPASSNDAFASLSLTPTSATTSAQQQATSSKRSAGTSRRGTADLSPADATEEDELEKRRALWQETWKEILPASHLLAASVPSSATTSAAAACPLADLLKPPLLTAFVSSLSEALLKSPSWFVRQQAGLALLSVSTAIVSQPMFILTTAASSLIRNVVALARSSASTDHQTDVQPSDSTPSHQRLSGAEDREELEDDEEELEEDEEEEDEEEDDEEDEEEETVFLIWSELVRLLASSLSQSGCWTGKVYLLRAARMLAQSALERGFAVEEANVELLNQIWFVLIRETRAGRTEMAGPGYRAEAFLALANFAEACGRDATGLTDSDNPAEDRLTHLLQLLLPNGIPPTEGGKSNSGKQKEHQISSDLTESEQEMAVRAVGILWPLQPTQEHVDRFVDTLRHLTYLMTQGGLRLQAAALASILAIFAKLTPEQSDELVTKNSATGKVAEALGLKELMARLKRAVDNTKSQILREYALGAIASILRHREFVNIVHDQLHHLVQSYTSSGASNLREWSAALLKSL